LGANNDATTESHDRTRIKIYVTSDEVALQTSNNNVPVLHVHGERGHCSNIHIKWRFRRGVLEPLFFTDSDHVGNADGTSNSGMVAFLNGNYFHGYSCGQKCLTMNTAEIEYIAVVKCLQFAIWAVLLLRELSFRVRYILYLSWQTM
jgi:hypothetical protein